MLPVLDKGKHKLRPGRPEKTFNHDLQDDASAEIVFETKANLFIQPTEGTDKVRSVRSILYSDRSLTVHIAAF